MLDSTGLPLQGSAHYLQVFLNCKYVKASGCLLIPESPIGSEACRLQCKKGLLNGFSKNSGFAGIITEIMEFGIALFAGFSETPAQRYAESMAKQKMAA